MCFERYGCLKDVFKTFFERNECLKDVFKTSCIFKGKTYLCCFAERMRSFDQEKISKNNNIEIVTTYEQEPKKNQYT